MNELSAGVEPEPTSEPEPPQEYTPPEQQLAAWRRHSRRVANVLKEMAPDLPETWSVLAAADRKSSIGGYLGTQLTDILSEYPAIVGVICEVDRTTAYDQMQVELRIYTTNRQEPYIIYEPLRGFPSDALLGKILVFT